MSKETWELEFDEYWQSFYEDDEENDFYLPDHVNRDVARRIWQTAFRLGGKQPWYNINREQLKVLMGKMK